MALYSRSTDPYHYLLLDDPDAFWRWHPAFWSEEDRAARRRATGRDILELQKEVEQLRTELRRHVDHEQEPSSDAQPPTSRHTPAPLHVRTRIRRRR
jgi:hypothetical protein